MKKQIEAERILGSEYKFFAAAEGAPLTVIDETQLMAVPANQETVFLDKVVDLIKFVFLYIPGASAIHLIMLGFALTFYYQLWSSEILVGTIGISVVSVFMIMLGLGKLGALKYLRVAGAVAATGAIFAVLYNLLIVFIPGDFFGLFARLTLPLTLLAGYLVKKDTDRTN